jgi:signal transduction histidine kinase/FixJ family two-component response regulator
VISSLRNWYRHLSVRLPIMSALFIVLAMTVFSYLVVEKETQTLSRELRKQAVALADNLAASTASYIIVKDYTSLESILIRAARFPSIVDIQAINDEGLQLADVYRNANGGGVSVRYNTKAATPPVAPEREIRVQGGMITVWQPVVLGDLVGWIRTRYTLKRIAEVRMQIWRHNALIGAVVAIIIILIISLYLRKPVQLIEQSTQFADELDVYAGKQMTVNRDYEELTRLMSALNRTSVNLQEKDEAISQEISEQQRLTDELELRVEKRTAELSVARDDAIHANRSKSEFLANMSHEIRTPLTAVIGFAESLLDSSHTMEERVDSINRIIQAGKHLLRVINEILDLSKIEANRLDIEEVAFPLIDVFRDVCSLVKMSATEKGLHFNITYENEVPETIKSDPVRFKQILINLCNNGIKFTKEGSINIKVSCDRSREQIIIKVIDTGIGLTQEQLSKLFKPFSQADTSTSRRYGGTGLGLHLSKQLAEKLGGSLAVESVPDVGSCFTLVLKTGDLSQTRMLTTCPDLEHFEHGATYRDKQLRLNGKVLLAEDNKDNQRLVSILLKRMGIENEIANNGEEAIAMAERGAYDVILMDVQMPVLDGLSSTRALREMGYTAPIVALTANAMNQEKQDCYDAGCNDVCTKPIDYPVFTRVLAKYLKQAANPVEQEGAPIVSELLKDEPDLLDLVQEFVRKLPDMIRKIEAAYNKKDVEELRQEVHTLKGTGGNFGYPELFELAKKIEFEIVANNFQAAGEMIESLALIAGRIAQGLETDEQAVSRDYPA